MHRLDERFTSPSESELRRDELWNVIGGLSVVVAKELEEDTIIIPEADEEITSTLVERSLGPILLGCGDEREMTKDSVTFLKEEGLPADLPYIRYFGGIYGTAWVTLVAATAQYGTDTLNQFAGPKRDFNLHACEMAKRIKRATDVIATTHSAYKNEGGNNCIDPNCKNPLGCAYAANKGALGKMAGSNKNIQNLAAAEYQFLLGPNSNTITKNIKRVSLANQEVASRELGQDYEKFSITRNDVIGENIPAMVLGGDHVPVADTFVLLNFSTDKLTSPQEAWAIHRPYYDVDIIQTAETIMRSNPALKLDPEILLMTMMLDVAATRAALAGSHGGPANPNRLPLVSYGDPSDGLKHLQSLNK